jgi:uncharacterized protein CbrC (UPF0167 family)
MARIENITKDKLVEAIAKFIKELSKKMGDKTNMEVDIDHSNWMCGMGANKKWSYTEIRFGGNSYIFKDKEITEEQFVYLLNKALDKSGIKGKVFYDTYGDGYWCDKQTIFRRLEIFNKPCKEFKELNKTIKKCGAKEIGEFDVFSVGICGKRSSHGDYGKYYYLCYQPNMCLSIIDYIKSNKGRNGIVKVEVRDYLDHGDDCDYRIAQYQESEWYGKRGNNLILSIKKGKNKKDYQYKFEL